MRRVTAGVVVIGRNEGQRLRLSLASVNGCGIPIVYVDSGSLDGSVDVARAMGVHVVELDVRRPFTAARARNEGLKRLREIAPTACHVQFVDGDCELAEGWIERAAEFLDARPDVAAVSGRLREKYPAESIYNMLCDLEWDRPAGEAKACGGIAMMRIAAFEAVNGFRDDLIAGEEPELCVRLRSKGWKIWRLPDEMAVHDAAMSRFGQWWRRSVRAGYAFAQGAAIHGAPPERHCVRESRSARFWGLVVPAVILTLATWWNVWALALLLIYPAQVIRLALRGPRAMRQEWLYAAFLVLAKFPELLGQGKFMCERRFGGKTGLIEYK